MALTDKHDSIDNGKLKLWATGFMVNESDDLDYDKNCPYFRCCLICGDIFQSGYDRTAFVTGDKGIFEFACKLRQQWASDHAKTHPEWMHKLFAESGLSCLPEAAHKLAPFGILPVGDMVIYQSIEDALKEAPRMPSDDVQGASKTLLRKVS